MAKEFGWRGNLLLALGSTILSLALVIGVGEFAVRYHERHRDTVPGTMPFLYYRHSRLGSALVRDTNYFGWVRVNRQGFRGPEVVNDFSFKPPTGPVTVGPFTLTRAGVYRFVLSAADRNGDVRRLTWVVPLG